MDQPVISFTKKSKDILSPIKHTPTDGTYSIYWPSKEIFYPYEIKVIRTGLAFSLPLYIAGIIFKETNSYDSHNSNFFVWMNVIHGGTAGELVVIVENKTCESLVFQKNDILCNIIFVFIETLLPVGGVIFPDMDSLSSMLQKMQI